MPPKIEAWPAFRDMTLWDMWRRYFRMRCVTPDVPYLDPSRHYLFVHFPHGVFPLGSFLSQSICGVPTTGLPGDTYAAIATALLHVPVLRHVLGWTGALPADRAAMLQHLQRRSLGLLPEGIAGVFMARHGSANGSAECIYARRRKGFVRLAMAAGIDIVPVYVFGQSAVLQYWGSPHLSRKLRVCCGIFWGRWGLPLPLRQDLVVAIGQPISVGQATSNPEASAVDAAHAAVLEGVTKLFDKHKCMVVGWEEKSLCIV